MRRVVQCLDGDMVFPENEVMPMNFSFSMATLMKDQQLELDAVACELSSASSAGTMSSTLSGGRRRAEGIMVYVRLCASVAK